MASLVLAPVARADDIVQTYCRMVGRTWRLFSFMVGDLRMSGTIQDKKALTGLARPQTDPTH